MRHSRVKFSHATSWLWDLKQVTWPLCASASTSVNGDGAIYPARLLWSLLACRYSVRHVTSTPSFVALAAASPEAKHP